MRWQQTLARRKKRNGIGRTHDVLSAQLSALSTMCHWTSESVRLSSEGSRGLKEFLTNALPRSTHELAGIRTPSQKRNLRWIPLACVSV